MIVHFWNLGLKPPGMRGIIGWEGSRSDSLNRLSYSLLIVVEVSVIIAIALLLILPIQDYVLSEFKESLRNPSPETSATFRQRQQEEPRVRLSKAAPFAAAALWMAIPLFRFRPKLRKSN
jgi:ABC-type maltose transport system permease subunit